MSSPKNKSVSHHVTHAGCRHGIPTNEGHNYQRSKVSIFPEPSHKEVGPSFDLWRASPIITAGPTLAAYQPLSQMGEGHGRPALDCLNQAGTNDRLGCVVANIN